MTDGLIAPGWDCHVHVFDAQAPVAPGHYAAAHHPLEKIEALAQSHGVGHLVLVQPSVYGTDNALILSALQIQPGRHRSVVVVDASISDAQLQYMHNVGVRGIRFNLISPTGNRNRVALDFHALAPRLAALGWHVQWYAAPSDWPSIAALHRTTTVVAVLDHLGGLHAKAAPQMLELEALKQLAGLGAWIKLSGWYRLHSNAPYTELDEQIHKVARMFAGHMLWGSDWPHTAFAVDAMPSYASQFEPVSRSLSPKQLSSILNLPDGGIYA